MMNRRKAQILWVGVPVIAAVLLVLGCAEPKPMWGDPASGLVLTYRSAEGTVSKYQVTSNVVQELNIMGQPTKTVSDAVMDFSSAAKGMRGGNQVFGITVDALRIDVSSAQGSMTADTGGTVGKGFDMVLSPVGKEMDLSGATALTYQTGPGAKNNLKPLFETIFPDLPARPAKIGDTWTSTDDTTTDDGNTRLHTVVANVDTLEGLETLDGRECIKVTRKMSGTMEGEGNQMGVDFKLSGTVTGTATWHFAYKTGVLAESSSVSSANADIESSMGTIPMTTKVTDALKLMP